MQNISTNSTAIQNQPAFLWHYQPIKTSQFHPDTGFYITYGLQLYQNENGILIPLIILPDISTNLDFVENLALTFTVNQLSPLHLYDAVLDAMP